MKKDIFVEIIIPIIVVMGICFLISFTSLNIGYKQGQKDALIGIYKYQITDTVPKYIIEIK